MYTHPHGIASTAVLRAIHGFTPIQLIINNMQLLKHNIESRLNL